MNNVIRTYHATRGQYRSYRAKYLFINPIVSIMSLWNIKNNAIRTCPTREHGGRQRVNTSIPWIHDLTHV